MTTDIAVIDAPPGRLPLQAEGAALARHVRTQAPQPDIPPRRAAQLQECAAGERRAFDVPLAQLTPERPHAGDGQ